MIDAKTRLVCLIGDPISHSVSPAIHNAAFRATGLNYVYLAFRVDRVRLGTAVEGLRSLGVAGFNVTIPHKVAVLSYLDALSSEAGEIGAVNTVVNRAGRLVGYNTDARGALNALLGSGFEVKGLTATVIGAGGAGRAVAYGLLWGGVDALYIVNRTVEKGRSIARSLKMLFRREVVALPYSLEGLKKALDRSDILVNCTPVGMVPNSEETPVPPSFLKRGMVVMDAVYNPVRTRLLREAEKRGAKVVDGVKMLVYQAAAAFKLWTGVDPPLERMFEAAYRALEGGRHGR